MNSAGSHSDWFSGTAAAATGLGILTFTFFPFALPLLILTVAATLPLVLPLVVFAAVAAILTGTWRGIRAAGRRLHTPGPSRDSVRRPRHPASGAASGLLARRPHKGT